MRRVASMPPIPGMWMSISTIPALPSEVIELQTEVAALRAQVAKLESSVASLNDQLQQLKQALGA